MVIAHILKIHKMKGSLLETEWLPLHLPWPHLFLPTALCTSFRPPLLASTETTFQLPPGPGHRYTYRLPGRRWQPLSLHTPSPARQREVGVSTATAPQPARRSPITGPPARTMPNNLLWSVAPAQQLPPPPVPTPFSWWHPAHICLPSQRLLSSCPPDGRGDSEVHLQSTTTPLSPQTWIFLLHVLQSPQLEGNQPLIPIPWWPTSSLYSCRHVLLALGGLSRLPLTEAWLPPPPLPESTLARHPLPHTRTRGVGCPNSITSHPVTLWPQPEWITKSNLVKTQHSSNNHHKACSKAFRND